MKKNYLIITLLFCSIMFAQTSVFTNTTGNNWSTAANWSLGLPTVTAQLNTNVTLDVDVSLSGSLNCAASTSQRTLTSPDKKKITIAVSSATISTGVLNNAAGFTYDAAIEFNNGGTATNVKSLQVNNTTGAPYRQLTFGPNSVLTLNSLMRVVTQFDSKVVFQGKIEGNSNLQLTGSSEFGTTADNTNYNGDFVFNGANANVTSNTTVDGGFLKATRKVQVNATGGTLTLNGANTFDGNLIVGGTNTFTLNVNANQETFGNVSVGGAMTINVAPAVTNLSFANSASNTWGAGTLAITGFEPGEIRFGTSNTALTAQQLSQITADGTAAGQLLALDANGYLVLASSLSAASFDIANSKRISYPTVVENQIYLSKTQNKVEVLDMTGKKVLSISNQNGIDSLTTSELNSGLYFIVFEGNKVEKFIKK